MNTIGWLFIFFGALIMRSVSKGRSISDIPGDMGDAMTAILSNDIPEFKRVLNRTTDVSAPDLSAPPTVSDGGINPQSGKHTQADLIALGKTLQARGFLVAEGPPPFGPIGKHSPTGYHYKKGEFGVMGMALDINWGSRKDEPAKMDALAPELVKAGWRVAWKTTGHYDHLHVDTGSAGRMTL